MPRRRNQRTLRKFVPTTQPRPVNRCVALLVVDNRPLQAAAWTKLKVARLRLEKASHDIHRHDETDVPSFRAWLNTTFLVLISEVRDLAEQVAGKGRIVSDVESQAYFQGRSPGTVWREMKRTPSPSGAQSEDPFADESGPGAGSDRKRPDDRFGEEARGFFEEDDFDGDDPFAGMFNDGGQGFFGFGSPSAPSPDKIDAKAIFRRLVQQLHPDRGGTWTPERARQWELVQQAWQSGDADWLARLEAEWEARTDVLGPDNSVGRLLMACTEIDAACRDAERRVREYRKDPAWRFSLAKSLDKLQARLDRDLRADRDMLRGQLDELEAIIAFWEKPRGRRGKQRRAKPARHSIGWGADVPF